MLFISHRGNVNGKHVDRENTIDYILEALSLGYYCEIDVWVMDDGPIYLGHDSPQYSVSLDFLLQHADVLWIHCKNLTALDLLLHHQLNVFFHDKDTYTITSHKFVWGNINSPLSPNVICVMPEQYDSELLNIGTCKGICSDFVQKYKELTSKQSIALFFAGRIQTQVYSENLASLLQIFDFSRYNVHLFLSLNENDGEREFTHTFENDVREVGCFKSITIRFEKTPVPDLTSYNKNSETIYDNAYSMFYHNFKAFEMIEASGLHFDVVIKSRFDMVSKDKLLPSPLDSNTVYIPNCNDWGGINDQVAYGDMESMKKYCDVVNNIIPLCNSGVNFHPETLLHEHLTQCLGIKRFDFKYELKKWPDTNDSPIALTTPNVTPLVSGTSENTKEELDHILARIRIKKL
jgi:glycerophosphoryl diester phosphodiesterase